MDSDNDSYHSENVLQENKNIVNRSNDTSVDEEMSTIQDFIEAQRPETRKIRPDKVINKVISEFS